MAYITWLLQLIRNPEAIIQQAGAYALVVLALIIFCRDRRAGVLPARRLAIGDRWPVRGKGSLDVGR